MKASKLQTAKSLIGLKFAATDDAKAAAETAESVTGLTVKWEYITGGGARFEIFSRVTRYATARTGGGWNGNSTGKDYLRRLGFLYLPLAAAGN